MIETMTTQQLRHAEKAIDTAEALSVEVKAEIEKLKALDMKVLVKKVSAVMFSGGSLSLEAIGLPADFFDKLEMLDGISAKARAGYRAEVQARLAKLEGGEDE
ncbi:hypothetical protein [Photobacterium halotolerans]|uniref:Uncharacterized protein n=1 Tax=Photobacterium halotolerans TaxID=265726 RepID=A0A7X5AS12_9GAMM|nr:hypothetical protein [Photobacterium halotolerans]NAW63901.1 hypothetical protein [Photobacterium halotolerans]